MLKFIVPFLMSFALFAQDITQNIDQNEVDIGYHRYVSLEDNKVYDVEIIVFAYQNSLPNQHTFINKPIFDDSTALALEEKPEDLEFTRIIDTQIIEDDESPEITPNNTSQFTVSLEDDESNIEVLTWFKHHSEFHQLTAIWEKLSKQQNIVPLVHQAWRQTETEFNNPIYVKISNLVEEGLEENDFDPKEPLESDLVEQSLLIKNTSVVSIDTEQMVEDKPIYSDYSLKGMVALSKGRYIHFGNKLNLFRTYNDSDDDLQLKNMVFSLTERRQVKVDQLHYFDSPWFGSIVKITEYKGEERDEEKDDNEQ